MLIEHKYLKDNSLAMIHDEPFVILASTKTKESTVFDSMTSFVIDWMTDKKPLDVLTELLIQMGYPSGRKSKAGDRTYDGDCVGYNKVTQAYEPVWHGNSGDYLVSQMSNGHIYACIRILQTQPAKKIDKNKWLRIFGAELRSRDA